MDLWQLKIFVRVVELGSFSKAGQDIHLSQPTISSHIKDLEEHFATRLVDRLARQVVPTGAGQVLYRQAKRMLALLNETESAMAEFLGQIKGCLSVGGSTIPGVYLLPRLIGLFSRDYPEVKVSLALGDSADIVSGVLEGRIEAGIVGAVSSNRQLRQTAIAEDKLCLVVPAGHHWAGRKAIAFHELFTEPFIVREPGSGTLRSLSAILRKKGHTLEALRVVAQMGSTEAVRQGIKSGLGVSVLSAIAVEEDVAAGLLTTLSVRGLNLKRHFYLTTHANRSLAPLCQVFIDFLKKALAAQQHPVAARLPGHHQARANNSTS